jgi:hypothetical protein
MGTNKPVGMTMSKPFDRIVGHFKRLTLGSRYAAGQAEAKVRQVNGLIRQLGETGRVSDTIILGPVIHVRAYSPGSGPSDSGQIVQGALAVPDGIGIVLWDSGDYAALSDKLEALEAQARMLF